MLKIRQWSDLERLPEGRLRELIQRSFQELLALGAPYDPDTHGWFLVMEDVAEFDDPEPFHGRFSLAGVMRESLFEHVILHGEYVEIVVALNDAEAVAVWVPQALVGALILEASHVQSA